MMREGRREDTEGEKTVTIVQWCVCVTERQSILYVCWGQCVRDEP